MNDVYAFLNYLCSLIAKVPSNFWGVLFGSFFTLLGIYYTNRATDSRSNREREMAFRKETYVAATKAIVTSLGAISKLAVLTNPMDEIGAAYADQAPVIAVVNLVATEDTIQALNNYGLEYGGAYLRLVQQRMVLDILQGQIVGKAALLKGFEKTRDTMLDLMQQHNIDGLSDARRFETLRGIFDFEVGRITTISQEIQHMTNELVEKHTPFARECLAESLRLNKILIPALVAVRMELGHSISEERYAEILYKAHPTIEGNMDDFIKKVSDTRDAMSR